MHLYVTHLRAAFSLYNYVNATKSLAGLYVCYLKANDSLADLLVPYVNATDSPADLIVRYMNQLLILVCRLARSLCKCY